MTIRCCLHEERGKYRLFVTLANASEPKQRFVTTNRKLAISHYGFVLSKGRVVAAGTPSKLADRQEVCDAYFS
jgi:hypothetical protein